MLLFIYFSLYRAQTQDEALLKFDAFAHRIPPFVQMVRKCKKHLQCIKISRMQVKEMYNVPGLQKICDILSENPTWSIAHLVAYFNLVGL